MNGSITAIQAGVEEDQGQDYCCGGAYREHHGGGEAGAEPGGEGGLEQGVAGGDEVAALVGEAGEGGADRGGGEFAEIGGDDAPGALDAELDADGADGEPEGGVGERPQRQEGQGEEGGQRDAVLAADLLRQHAEEQAADDGGDVVEHHDQRDGGVGQVAFQPQEDLGIQVLRAVAHEIEGGHQGDCEDAQRRVVADDEPQAGGLGGAGALVVPAAQPFGAFGHAQPDIDRRQQGAAAEDEQPAPADEGQQQEHQRRQQVSGRVAGLQDARGGAAP